MILHLKKNPTKFGFGNPAKAVFLIFYPQISKTSIFAVSIWKLLKIVVSRLTKRSTKNIFEIMSKNIFLWIFSKKFSKKYFLK
jgi:hypothetical protein